MLPLCRKWRDTGYMKPSEKLTELPALTAIDLEELMFFGVGWEPAHVEVRLDEHYRHPREEGPDKARLRVYKLCLHPSLCSGPLRLLEGGSPNGR